MKCAEGQAHIVQRQMQSMASKGGGVSGILDRSGHFRIFLIRNSFQGDMEYQ